MKKIHLFVASLVFGLATTANASMSVEEYLEGQAGQRDGSDLSNLIYVWGVMDALGAFDDAIRAHLGHTLFCVDEENGRVTVERMIAEIDREIEFARKRVIDFSTYTKQTTVGDVGLIVLSNLHKCDS